MSPRTIPKASNRTLREKAVSKSLRKRTILKNRKCKKHFQKSKKVMLRISQGFLQLKINMP